MAGLYIHIPFCKSRCTYCAFYSTTDLSLRQRYVDALCREIELRGVANNRWDTIYLGGGTPSQLTSQQLRQLLWRDREGQGEQEVTIECNPDDVTDDLAALLADLPVNRVSMGVQTFSDSRLRFLRRRHTSAQVETAISLLRQAGIANISIDLMFGFPEETIEEWQTDISRAVALDIEHLSAYCLTYEEGTPLHRLLTQGKVSEADEEVSREMYYRLIDQLAANGFEHYEISNFARPGYRSRHNSSYWNGTPYTGIGAAAHSYDGKERQWNIADIRAYIEGVERGTPVVGREQLDDTTRYNDRLTVALRTREGLDLDTLAPPYRQYCTDQARRYIESGELRVCTQPTASGHQHAMLSLTRRGLFVSDMVISHLMMV